MVVRDKRRRIGGFVDGVKPPAASRRAEFDHLLRSAANAALSLAQAAALPAPLQRPLQAQVQAQAQAEAGGDGAAQGPRTTTTDAKGGVATGPGGAGGGTSRRLRR